MRILKDTFLGVIKGDARSLDTCIYIGCLKIWSLLHLRSGEGNLVDK